VSEIGLRIDELLQEKYGDDRPSIDDLAHSVGMTHKTVSLWIKNRVDRPDFDSLKKWADFLGVHPGELIFYKPDVSE
jgi:DNA-binding Xre family transcriptional regulator